MHRKKRFSDKVPTSVILPIPLQEAIARRAIAEDRSFGAIIRRALKREMGMLGLTWFDSLDRISGNTRHKAAQKV